MTWHDPYEELSELREVGVFSVTSTSAAHNRAWPLKYRNASVGGQDISPQLAWSGFPAETKSFAVTIYDPDAPTGSGFWHWAVYNIPAEVTELDEGAGALVNALPDGALTLKNEIRTRDYTGAAPPPGTGVHRYFTVVHALDVDRLGLDPESTPAVLGFNLHFHTLARAIMVPTAAAEDF